jgi:hypothetical protein
MKLLAELCFLLALTPQARGQVLDKCQAAKIRAAGKKTFDKAKCRAKALQKGVALDPLCVTKAEDKFAEAITKADTLGSCSGTATDIEAAVDQCVADYVTLLSIAATPVLDKCQAAKIKAMGKKTFDKAKCRAKALQKGVALDPLCLTKAEDKFTQAIAKADALGSCSGAATDLEAAVDQCVNGYAAVVGAPATTTTVIGTTTTVTPTSTTSTTLACGAGGAACNANSDCCSGLCILTGPSAHTCETTTTTTTSSTTTTLAVKLAFVTGGVYDGNLAGLYDNLTGVDAADAICNLEAVEGGWPATWVWKAWISDSTSSPSTRFTQWSGPYRTIGGQTIANSWADLTDGALAHPIDVDARNFGHLGDYVLTATKADGTYSGSNDCSGWTSNSAARMGDAGDTLFTDLWSLYAPLPCDGLSLPAGGFRLYCFQQ